jgi:hypothetical protein
MAQTYKDEQQQRQEHDDDLAGRVVDLMVAEDVDEVRFPGGRDRMVERIKGALNLARMHERAIQAPPIIDALQEATRTIEKYRNG